MLGKCCSNAVVCCSAIAVLSTLVPPSDSRAFFPVTFHALIVDQNLWCHPPSTIHNHPLTHPLFCIAPNLGENAVLAAALDLCC